MKARPARTRCWAAPGRTRCSAGAGGDLLAGGAGADSLDGWDGTDTPIGGMEADNLYGGAGADMMLGGAGDDFYTVGVVGAASTDIDRVLERVGEGNDTVLASQLPDGFSLAGAGEVEVLLLGSGTRSGTGNTCANRIIGNENHNTLRGGGGDDTLEGGAGDDLLRGDAGADRFVFLRDPIEGVTIGRDVVADFTPGTDVLALTGSGYDSFAGLRAAMAQHGADVVIDLGGDAVVLRGVLVGAITAADIALG